MSTNVSKKKREDLLSKIGQIRTFIASASQDTNTGNLLSYLSELEKDINGKNTASFLRSTKSILMRFLNQIHQY